MAYTAASIKRLVENSIEEGQSLEFKAMLPDRSDRGKAELLKDVVGLANADGGSIIYGIEEKAGAAHRLAGLVCEDVDLEQRRILQILESQIEPPISNIRIDWIDVEGAKICSLFVPNSLSKPHRYTQNGHSKFVVRNHTHVSEMSYSQIEDTFLFKNKLGTRLDEQWAEWRHLAETDQMFRPLVEGARLFIGLIPISAIERRQQIDLEAIYDPSTVLMNGSRWGGCSKSFNFEGLAVYSGYRSEKLEHLAQISRYGEIIFSESIGHEWQGKRIIPSVAVTHLIVETVSSMLAMARNFSLEDEWYLSGELSGVADYSFAWRSGMWDEASQFPRARLPFPRLRIKNLEAEDNCALFHRPWLDVFWQMHGLPKCHLYQDDGSLKN